MSDANEISARIIRESVARVEAEKFCHGDVVRFADGNGKMHLWGDNVNVTDMFVDGYTVDGLVRTTWDNYTFQIEEAELVKVGHQYDTEYNDEGEEVYIWLPELNERED